MFDIYGQECIKVGRFSAGEIDSVWSKEIKDGFRVWAKENKDKLPMSVEKLNKYLEERNF